VTRKTRLSGSEGSKSPRYPKPKILLVDVEPGSRDALEAEGYNVSSGSFGLPYKVPISDKDVPVIPNGELEHFAEQEIIVIDLLPTELLDEPIGEKVTSRGTNDVWASSSTGVIDPRPRIMEAVRNDADRVFSNGGLFVVFADARYRQSHYIGRTVGYSWPEKMANYPFDNWSFLSILDDFRVRPDEGREISVTADSSKPLGKLLANHAKEAEFLCTLSPQPSLEKAWITLAVNKYGESVAGVIATMQGNGAVLVFPQIEDKGRFLVELIKYVVPDFMPELFPYAEGVHWVQHPEYEIPEIQALKDEVDEIKEEARRRVAERQEIIEAKRAETSYMHDLIGGTDRPLVLAVKKALEDLGFESVVDVDEQMDAAGDRAPRKEDLQIHDNSPTLLVEVKGISGMPSDEDALAVSKYLAPRMKEWGRLDVKGLSIVNHQRHVPGLDRNNEMTFREDVLTSARQQDIGLMTAWDLFRLLRSYLKNDWQPEHVKPLFYKSGRISPVPEHYEFVGVIERFIPSLGVLGLKVMADKVEQGDRLAFDLPIEFQEQNVESLEVDNEPVDKAEEGSLAGIKTILTKAQARNGVRVFRVIGEAQLI
jgi:hypothetical protein